MAAQASEARDDEVVVRRGRRWWREWEFIDWFGVAIAVATAIALITLTLATTFNADGSTWP